MMMMLILMRVMAVMARRAPRPVNGQRAHQGPARPPRSVHGHTPAPRAVHKARSASTSTPTSARRGPASLLRPSLGLSCLSLAKWLLPQPALGGPAGPCRGLQSTALTEVSPHSFRSRGPVRRPVLIRSTHESMSRCVWVRGAHRRRRGLQGQRQRTRPGKRRGLAPKSEPN